MFLFFFQSVARRLGIRATLRHAQLASGEGKARPTHTAAVIDSAPLSAALSTATRARAALGAAPRHTVTLSTALA